MARKGEGPGQKWIRFLRGYTPNAQSQKMFAEHISNLAQHYGIEPIAFEHPFREQLYSYFFTQDGGGLLPSGDLRNVVLTGTAGDGKTSLCYDLWTRLCDSKPPTGILLPKNWTVKRWFDRWRCPITRTAEKGTMPWENVSVRTRRPSRPRSLPRPSGAL